MLLNKSSFESALFCVLLLCETDSGHTLSSAAMASYFDLSPTYLVKVLKDLVKHGVLTSYIGKCGGYTIAPGARTATLLDIAEAIQPDLKVQFRLECLEARMTSPHSPQSLPVSNGVAKAVSVWSEELASITIGSLLDSRMATEPADVTVYRRAFVKAFQRELPREEGDVTTATAGRYRSIAAPTTQKPC